jgi:hypothetical protein
MDKKIPFSFAILTLQIELKNLRLVLKYNILHRNSKTYKSYKLWINELEKAISYLKQANINL